MKKILSFVIILVFLVSCSILASAKDLSDGIYEIPVTLMHKEDEKESFGNKYIAQTALLEVKKGKKIITIALTTDMKGIEFSYYTNGSLTGNVNKGQSVSNVTVAGKTYKQGFEIPIVADGDIGLQFSVPVMPMSPSARLRISYDKAVMISKEETTVTQKQTTSVSATKSPTVPSTENSTAITAESDTTVITTQLSTEETTTVSGERSSLTHKETTTYVNETLSEKPDDTKTPAFVYVLIFIGLTVGIILLLTYKKSREKKGK